MPEPESCAQAAQPKGRPSAAAAYTDNHLLHWRVPSVIGDIALSGRAFSVWLWARATSEAIGQTAWCLGVVASLVSAAGQTTGSSLTTVLPAVAHTPTQQTHTHAHHTDEQRQRCRPRECRMQVRLPALSECAAWGSDLSRRVCMV